MAQRGTIQGFGGNHLSGIGFLIVDGKKIPCDNAPTVRALDAAFGGVIGPGHNVDNNTIRGKEIVYETDWLGLLEWFVPADEYVGDAEQEN